MQITANSTSYPAELFVHADKHAQRHCILVLKATFDVRADGSCVPADDQQPLQFVDQHHGDPGSSALRFESDFVPFKPRAEVLLDAAAIAPGQQPVEQLEVGLAGPGLLKRATVNGDRVWESSLMHAFRASPPQPFLSMPLSWDRAFGGSDQSHESAARHGSELRNLVGRGFRLNPQPSLIPGTLLPNIEHPDLPMRFWDDKPEPLGFGPLGRAWQPRASHAGTYDEHWMTQVKPFLPQDFDERYFQAAPLDQQLAHLAPGSAFACMNMSASGRFVAYLPRFELPVRFRFQGRSELRQLRADTLILQPGQNRLMLIGRVSVALARKAGSLREVLVGRLRHQPVNGKNHYPGLDQAVAALRRRNGQ